MKKIYFLSLLFCLGFRAFAQPVTATIWANALALTYTTGNATAGARNDNSIVTTAATQRGYAVFDLSGIPAGSVVNSVVIGMYCTTYGGSGAGSGFNTYGFAGDLSTVTVPATLFADMITGTSLSVATYGLGVGNQTLPTTAASQTFIQNAAGSKVSICFTGGGTRIYTFMGETGNVTSTLTANHAPYMTVTYCPPPNGLIASASPNPLCVGDMLTLNGAATGTVAASGGYSWAGPGGYTSGIGVTSFTVTPTSAGVYTLTAVNSCTTYSATATLATATVTVNPLPVAITGATEVCTGGATSLTSGPLGGSWTSSNSLIASVGLSTGLVVGVSAGAVTISYTLSTGCYVTSPMTDNDPPDPISGPAVVCENSTITLTDAIPGGTWSSDLSTTASVGPSTGVVTGVAAGLTTISYVTGGCPGVGYDVSVNPAPAPVVGPAAVCALSTVTETDATSGGSWSSSPITIAMVGTSTGVVTGVSSGIVNIIYTLATTGCQSIKVVAVNALPAPISGPTAVCELSSITATDPTPGGSFSTLGTAATVSAGGLVTGVSAGTEDISYIMGGTGCYVTETMVVNPLPAPITGSATFCVNTTTTLGDADPGGTWTSQNTAIATVGSSSGIVTGITTPGTNISYTLGTGCASVVMLVINPAPLSVITPAGATTFCAGGNVVLNGSVGGTSYQWNGLGGPIAGETNTSYTAFSTDTYTLDITNGFGCTTRSAGVDVTAGIDAAIDYTTALNFCIGGSITLSANTGAAVGLFTYQWQKNAVNIPGANFNTYTATTSGLYTCVVTISGGSGSCVVTTPAVNVAVNALPTPAISFNGVALSTPNTYSVYQWFVNSVAIPGATNYTLIPPANGIYRVRVSDAIGCSGYSNAIEVTNVGVQQISKAELKIYPNPANDVLYIESQAPVRAVITGIEGKVQMEDNNARKLNISSLAAGIYILMVYDENGERLMVQKLVKE